MTVTVLAGTPLHELNAALEKLGLSLHNMGDIDEQTIAGAISTGTHGTGGRVASLSAQVAGLEMVTGGRHPAPRRRRGEPGRARRWRGSVSGRSASSPRSRCASSRLFTLAAHEAPMRWDEALDRFDELAASNEHFEMYWFPHTDRLLTKRNNRTLEPAEPLSRFRAWLDDEFLSNRVFGWSNRLDQPDARARPPAQRPLRPGAERTSLQRRPAQGVHLPSPGGLPGDGVRRAARGRRRRRSARHVP